MSDTKYSIARLNARHERQDFTCGNPALDRYLLQQASQDARRNLTVTYVLTERDANKILGFYTLSATSVPLMDLPEEIAKKLPKYPVIPATLLGRLTVSQKHQGNHLGELLLIDALRSSCLISQNIASMAVVVEAENAAAVGFYRKYEFIPFTNQKQKLFLPLSTVKQLWLDG